MGRVNMFNMSAVLFASFVGFYSGVKFFEPIIVEKLREDGNLRSDMEFPLYDENGEAIIKEGEVAPRLYKGVEGIPTQAKTVESPIAVAAAVMAPPAAESKKISVVEEVKKELETKK